MKKYHSYRPSELAARITLNVQERQARDPHFLMGDMVEGVSDRYGCSRACAYRYLRIAVDVLGITYDDDPIRIERQRERLLDARENSRVYGGRIGVERPGVRRHIEHGEGGA